MPKQLPDVPHLRRVANRRAHQRYAIENPCAKPEDCRDWMDRYSRILRLGDYSATVQLQVHIGELARETTGKPDPVWCASVGLLTDLGRIVPIADYARRHYALALSAAKTVMDGVGEEGADEATEPGVTTLLVRRRCSVSEIALLQRAVEDGG